MTVDWEGESRFAQYALTEMGRAAAELEWRRSRGLADEPGDNHDDD